MPKDTYKYVIVGAGLAGASAIGGMRENDPEGSIAIFGDEKHLPYNRPPLSKELWSGKAQVEDIFVNGQDFYEENKVKLIPGATISSIDPTQKTITDNSGESYRYDALLLTTGGKPRILPLPGGDLGGICYYRYLRDFNQIRPEAREGKSAVIIGGGFIGSEIACAFNINKVKVTMIFPDAYLCARTFPESLGKAIQGYYIKKGVAILHDKPVSFVKQGDKFITHTEQGKSIESDIMIIGVGIKPETGLAQTAGLEIKDGIIVNEYLQTSNQYIYAARDNAYFPCKALEKNIRVEHWDNALKQGKLAGKNMSGAKEPVDYLPYFFSELFEFGYEAVGDIDSKLDTSFDWQEENRKGVIYYSDHDRIRGVVLCNIPKKVSAARKLIREGAKVSESKLLSRFQ